MASLLLWLAALCIGQAASTASHLLLLAVICIGQDASMASLLLAAGAHDERRALPNVRRDLLLLL
jgi:ATP-dependent protease ClpP protease subunit